MDAGGDVEHQKSWWRTEFCRCNGRILKAVGASVHGLKVSAGHFSCTSFRRVSGARKVILSITNSTPVCTMPAAKTPEMKGESSTAASKAAMASSSNGSTTYELPWYVLWAS